MQEIYEKDETEEGIDAFKDFLKNNEEKIEKLIEKNQ